MLTNIHQAGPPDPEDRPSHEPTTADDIIKAIRLAREEFKSCEVVTNLRKAEKLLLNLGYKPTPFRKGLLLNFEKANIYVHE